MKAEELRIGNVFKWSHYASMGFGDDVVTIQNIHHHELMEPISLTEERLKRAGFSVSDREDNAWVHPESGLPLWWNDERNGAYHINSELLVSIDHVHQLQNLYFALTGEELTFS